MERGVSLAHVGSVLAVDDRVLRNYWVTQTYADLSAALAEVLEPSTANWCTFATWASDTVGRNLRGEDLPKWLHDRIVLDDGMMGAVREANERRHHGLGHLLYDLTPEHVFDVVRELFGACAANLSDGNSEVFSEIAPVAATFVECAAGKRDASARDRVLEACEGALEFEEVNRLRAGFSLWWEALDDEDPVRKSQRILAGSLDLGTHEQNHLQAAIAGSIDMGVNQAGDALVRRLARDPSTAEAEPVIAHVLHPVVDGVAGLWGDLMTELLGTIVLPDGTLQLDHDVPVITGEPFAPRDLVPVVVDELATLLARFDRTHGSGMGSRAADWVVLDDRMNFITNLFRSRHHRTKLFDPPFGPGVLAEITADRIPGQSPRHGNVSLVPGGSRQTTFARATAPATAKRPNGAPTIGLDRFTDEFLEHLRTLGDEPADAAVDEFFAATAAESADHLDRFRRLVRVARSDDDDDDEDFPGVREFVRAEESWPSWADPDLVRRGQQVFGDWGPQLGMGLWMASLPADYACARGAEPLVRTARLTRSPKGRYLETGQMIIDAMTPNGLDPGGRGYQTIRHVRLMHAAVRHVLLHGGAVDGSAAPTGAWDAALGIPVNQEDLLGCLFSFSVVGIECVRRAGVPLRDADAEAYVHAWNVVGHQLGIRDDLLPLDWADARALWERLKRLEYAPSDAGRELTQAAIECMQDMLGWSILHGLPASGVRHYLGNETADLLGVPPEELTGRAFFMFVRLVDAVFERTVARLPFTRSPSAVLGLRMLRGFEQCERQGDRPAFEITDELKQAWGIRVS